MISDKEYAFPGKIVKELAKKEENCRNSEGSFYRFASGRIVFAYSRYRSGSGDDGDVCDIAIIESNDDGRTFSNERIIIRADECNARNIMSVSLLPLKDGRIAIFYLKKEKGLLCRPFMRTTRDFESFSSEQICIDEKAYFVMNNDRVKRLSDGRIVLPVAWYTLEGKEENLDFHNAWLWKVPRSHGRLYVSNDEGETFSLAADLEMPFQEIERGLEEPGLEELEDGRLYFYFRNFSGRQLQSISCDGGNTWSTPTPSRFTSPTSAMYTRRLQDGRIMFLYNPKPLYFGRSERYGNTWTGGRNPFVLTVSDGNMRTFDEIRTLEDDESRGFCYCAILETDEAILLGYCAGGDADNDGLTLTRTRIRRIRKQDV